MVPITSRQTIRPARGALYRGSAEKGRARFTLEKCLLYDATSVLNTTSGVVLALHGLWRTEARWPAGRPL
ncbi:protein of unknown function [Nitrospira japonica]|uniref:Uncharacterized protein n=1 Tax=Nitrospira japonica TaxID=1325564 RepID=A0A1W1I9U1_9BACT|nr:protein of unknown function [Nitrospira japonica]